MIGDCYLYGTGVEKSEEEARRWLSRSAAQGFADAVEALKRLDGE